MKRIAAVYIVAIIQFFTVAVVAAQDKISLAGKWSFALDPDSLGYAQNWSKKKLSKTIQLPRTTDEAGYGTATTDSDYGILTRAHKYVGPAWYQKTITIPASWKDKTVSIYLERVLWESKVYVDGKEISTLSPLYVAHQHNLGVLSPGNHVLTICVNNSLIHSIGDKGHGYTDYTQSLWNGIVGRIELQKAEKISLQSVQAFPDAVTKKVQFKAQLVNAYKTTKPAVITAMLKNKSNGQTIAQQSRKINVKSGSDETEIVLENLKGIRSWDEFDPQLYEVVLQVKDGNAVSQWKDNIGFRKVSTTQHKVLLNDKVAYIRGNLDCVHFPLTGYPSCDEHEWERIFKKYKDYGLNTVRFHSWCPPEAAFRAADKLGIYIQAEIIWLDWWMAINNPERPEMYTIGMPDGLGKNPGADAFVQAEMKRIMDAYGNHPSFVFFCIGNELGNSDFNVMEKWVEKIKREDPRRLYAVSTARKIMPVDDYSVTHNIPGIGGTYGNSLNKTDAGLEKNYSKATIPIIAHEVGQYPVYPEWKEIEKYKGVLKARNLEGFKKMAEKNGIADQDKDFQKASGALQQLLYKNLIENVLLAPSSAGYQLLSMQDYQGQGEALIGWLDAFWDDKGIAKPEDFRQHSNAVVPLIRTNSFTYTHKDTIRLSMEVANYYIEDISKPLNWEITDAKKIILKKGTTVISQFPQGKLTTADDLSILCAEFPNTAGEYIFQLSIPGTAYKNSWTFYVFPSEVAVDTNGIYIAREWNEKVDEVLKNGGKVLLIANKLGTKSGSHQVDFSPLFWSASFFPGQSNETLGSFINDKSAVFNHFPTSYFTNWQWHRISAGAKYFDLSGMNAAYKPIVQPVSDFHYNKKLGSLFETKVGNGKLFICGYDLDAKQNVFTQQLFYSITAYMKSGAFAPSFELPAEQLKTLLMKTPVAANETLLPDQFTGAALYVHAADNAVKEKKEWFALADNVTVSKGFSYAVTDAQVYKKDSVQGWTGRKMNIKLTPPNGVKGYVYIHFSNPSKAKTSGLISIEGRELQTGEIPARGKWIKLFMMREDTNDGKLDILVEAEGKASVDIDKLVIMVEE